LIIQACQELNIMVLQTKIASERIDSQQKDEGRCKTTKVCEL